MYQQHYQVGDKKFVGAYAGLYESALTGEYCHFILPEYHIQHFLSVDVPNLKNYTTKDLVKKKIAQLRDENDLIRLSYTGGQDSHTIMLTAQELGIRFDSLFTFTNSVVEDPYVEYEFVSGIEYARNTGMQHTVHRPSIAEFEKVWKDPYSFTKYDDFYHGFAPHYSDVYFENYPKDYFEIIGNDKPRYYCKDGTYYWIITDFSDWCLNRKHEDFFLGSTCPELAVKQVTLGVEYLKKYYPNKQGFIDYKNVDTPSFCKHLSLVDSIDNKIRKTNEDHTEYGYLNEKHRRSITQLLEMGRRDIVDSWIEVSEFIDQSLKDAPHGIERRNVYVPEVDCQVKLTTNIVRTGAILKVLEDGLELIPHTDIRRL